MSVPASVSKRVVVAGAGTAAGYVAREFAKRGRGSELALVGEESVPPYERPALSKAFLFPSKPARLPGFHTCVGEGDAKQDETWYSDNSITALFGELIHSADLSKRTLTTTSGRHVEYETLVIATGSSAAKLPSSIGGNLNNVHYIRNHDDALNMYSSLEKSKQAAVVGGGYIGIESACALGAWQIPSRMAFPEPHLMARLFPQSIAEKYERLLESKGITVKPHSKVKELVGDSDGNLCLLRLESGEDVECDTAIVGVGAKPRLEPFTDQLQLEQGGFKVDSRFRASGAEGKDIPPNSVYAIGDVAAFPLKMAGNEYTRNEHVLHARESAKSAAQHTLGEDPGEYDYLPSFYSRGFEHPGSDSPIAWVFYGLQEGSPITVGNFNPKLAAFWVGDTDNKLYGIMLESGSNAQKKALPNIARKQPQVDKDTIKNAKDVNEALSAIGVPAE
jgi:monodehydroascorbate reductase (NADH)